MLSKVTVLALADPWKAAQAELHAARARLAGATSATSRQQACNALLDAERACTSLVHSKLASALELEPVHNPRLVLALDVDGVLEDESEGFSSTALAGAAALKLLQLGGVAVLLCTARGLDEVKRRVAQFQLLGGVSGFGSQTWDAVFEREATLVSPRGEEQLHQLRQGARAEQELVIHSGHDSCVRVSRVVRGRLAPLETSVAREMLESSRLAQLTFWTATRYTDFVDRSVGKDHGLQRLLESLGLGSLPLAAMGDSTCDLPMLRIAAHALIPPGALSGYSAREGQHVSKTRSEGSNAVWEAACRLVPSTVMRRRALSLADPTQMPAWIPAGRIAPPRPSPGLLFRLSEWWDRRPALITSPISGGRS
jgi:3-deoxy-D-manno-octulosonate 8-phosphate phosphatase KdsC-like HAD superfamily phosphatase